MTGSNWESTISFSDHLRYVVFWLSGPIQSPGLWGRLKLPQWRQGPWYSELLPWTFHISQVRASPPNIVKLGALCRPPPHNLQKTVSSKWCHQGKVCSTHPSENSTPPYFSEMLEVRSIDQKGSLPTQSPQGVMKVVRWCKPSATKPWWYALPWWRILNQEHPPQSVQQVLYSEQWVSVWYEFLI